jgi:hypothetical protein
MSIDGMTQEIALNLQDAYNYLELGAVSPDLPYLAPFSKKSGEWGNTLHHERTVETVRSGVSFLPTLTPGSREHKRIMAWLFGYASHVVADMISHPVVTLKVGPYETHKVQHRVCELNQDTYIFQTYFQDKIINCEYLDHGVKTCTKSGKPGKTMASFLKDFWQLILKDVYPEKPTPNPAKWFKQFVVLIDKFAEEGHHFVSVIRGFAEDEGYAYPNEPDMTYVTDLLSPYGQQISFDTLFYRFQEETKKVWGQIAQAIDLNDPHLITLQNGDLDTGLDLADNHTSVFWNQDEGIA